MNPRPVGLAAGALLVLGAMGGMWDRAHRAERFERDRADAALARSAAAFLSVVVPPGPANGYDPARLIASVNNLARASFWPGGLQLALGSVALLPDTIGLLPIPDSALRQLEAGREAVVVRHARRRVALVPFLDRDRYGLLGWVAVWETVPASIPATHGWVVTIFGAAALLALVVPALPGRVGRRTPGFLATGVALALLGLDLRWSVGTTVDRAATVRVATLKRLIEFAATAPGVRQAALPEIAVGVQVRPSIGATSAGDSAVVWRSAAGAVVARAATPRTGGALELVLAPEREGLTRLDRGLALWVSVGLAGLLLLGTTVRYSSGTTGPPLPGSA